MHRYSALISLLAFAGPGHVLFGRDWPFAPELSVSYFTGYIDAYAALDWITRQAIDRGNGSRLCPALSGCDPLIPCAGAAVLGWAVIP